MLNVDNSIFDVYLVSVSKSAMIDCEDSLSNNISRAVENNEVSLLTRILVNKLPCNDQFKEIITGRRISGCISYTDWQYCFTRKQKLSNYDIDNYAFIKPLYVNIPIAYIGYRNDIYHRYFIKATYDRIDEYIKENIDVIKYKEKLDYLFDEARHRYEEAASNYNRCCGSKYRRLVRGK